MTAQLRVAAWLTETDQGTMLWLDHKEACAYTEDGEPEALVKRADVPSPTLPSQPYCWAVHGSWSIYTGNFAELDARAEAKRCGGTTKAFPLFKGPVNEA